MSVTRAIVVLVLCSSAAGCGGSGAPSAPSPVTIVVAPLNPNGLVVFREPGGFSTTDLRDAHGRIIQLTNGGDLIWTPDGSHVPGYEISPDSSYWGPPTYFIGRTTHVCVEFCVFSVRFGTDTGQRRAYLTIDYGHDNPGTLVDVEVAGGTLLVRQTSMYPPGTPTLSGTVTEMTSSGPTAVSGAYVARAVAAGWQSAVTDQNGTYKISGLIDGTDDVVVIKEGYQSQSRQVHLAGDVRFDVELMRR
jgi:uncharacterized membrane protein